MLLLDDIAKSGASLVACREMLYEAGAETVVSCAASANTPCSPPVTKPLRLLPSLSPRHHRWLERAPRHQQTLPVQAANVKQQRVPGEVSPSVGASSRSPSTHLSCAFFSGCAVIFSKSSGNFIGLRVSEAVIFPRYSEVFRVFVARLRVRVLSCV